MYFISMRYTTKMFRLSEQIGVDIYYEQTACDALY